MSTAPSISLLGSSALLFEAPGELDLAPQQRIWRLALQAGEWPEIHEAVPGMNNLMLAFSNPPRDIAALRERLAQGKPPAKKPRRMTGVISITLTMSVFLAPYV